MARTRAQAKSQAESSESKPQNDGNAKGQRKSTKTSEETVIPSAVPAQAFSVKKLSSTRNKPSKAHSLKKTKAIPPKNRAAESFADTDNDESDELTVAFEPHPEPVEHRSSFLDLPHEVRTLIYEFAALSCSELEPIKARNTLEYRIFPLPVIHYVRKDKIDNRPAAQKPSKHTLHNLMRLNHHMYDEVKAALYRYVPVLVTLGKAGSKQAFDIGRRPVDFRGTDFLSELSYCRTIVLKEGWQDIYKREKPQQIVDELSKFLAWWQDHGGHHIRTRLHIAFSAVSHWYDDSESNSWPTWQGHTSDLFDIIGDWVAALERDMQDRVRLQVLNVNVLQNNRPYVQGNVLNLCRRFPALVDSSVDISALLKDKEA